MHRAAPLLIGFLLPVAGLLTIVAVLHFANSLPTWGLAVAQVQLAAAAAVLMRHWLALRILALVACLLFWAAVFAMPGEMESSALTAMLLVTVALFTAAWCGMLVFGGWRLADSQAATPAVVPRQFSLATLLLASAIVCIYGGLWRWVDFSSRDYPVLMTTLMSSLVGCTMLKVTARGSWPWLPPATILAMAMLNYFLPVPRVILGHMTAMIAAQIPFLLAVLVVLRVAGIFMMRDAANLQLDKTPESSVPLGASTQALRTLRR